MRESEVVGSTHGRGCKALRKPGGGTIRLEDDRGPAGGGGLRALVFGGVPGGGQATSG